MQAARESHLAGKPGRALLTRMEEIGWAKRVPDSRTVRVSHTSKRAFDAAYPPVENTT